MVSYGMGMNSYMQTQSLLHNTFLSLRISFFVYWPCIYQKDYVFIFQISSKKIALPIIPVTVISTKRMEPLRMVSARKQLLDRNATAMVRKTMLIPLRCSWNASQNSRKLSKGPKKTHERRNGAKNTATLVIPTRNRMMGTVVPIIPQQQKV